MKHGLAVAVAALLAGATTSTRAVADGPIDCKEALERAQQLEGERRLIDARAEYAACSRSECGPELQSTCGMHVAELGARIPSIRVEARSQSGRLIEDAHVFLDGNLIVGDKREIDVAPGDHVVRAEAPGYTPREDPAPMREGEQRTAVVTLSVIPYFESTIGPPAEARKPLPSTVWGFGGAGAVGLVSFITFSLLANSAESDWRSACARGSCEGGAFRSEYLIADLSLGLFVLGAGATGFAAWTHYAEARQRQFVRAQAQAQTPPPPGSQPP